jgi:phosphocarrier protein
VGVVERRATVANELGLHARPAATFVKLAGKFRSEISITKDSMMVNGKSIMGVMTLAAECGSLLIIRAEGDDAETAARALADLVDSGFQDRAVR